MKKNIIPNPKFIKIDKTVDLNIRGISFFVNFLKIKAELNLQMPNIINIGNKKQIQDKHGEVNIKCK